MKMTYQTVSGSGSFGAPYGTDVEFGTKKDASDILYRWIREHDAVGSDSALAELWAFIGNRPDVEGMEPDYVVSRGIRGGTVWSNV